MSKKKQRIAVFASDMGAGDPERSSIMVQAGAFFASQKISINCYVQRNNICTPFISSLKRAGGDVTIFADEEFELPSTLADINIEILVKNSQNKLAQLSQKSDGFIGLPGSLLSVKLLFDSWVASEQKKPIALLNKNRHFEFIRGFIADIASVKLKKIEQKIIIADNIEDLWHRFSRLL